MCTHCNNSNCSDCNQYTSSQTHICDGCQEQSCEGCAVKDLSTDCSVFTGDSIECDSIVVVAKNTILSDALANIVSWSCTKFSAVENFFRIINTGNGVNIFSGVSLLGEKKLRRLKSTNGSVIITQGTDDIDFSVPAGVIPDGTETKIVNGTNTTVVGTGTTPTPYQINALNSTYSNSNLGTGAQIYKDSIIVGSNTQFNLRKIKSSNSSVNIVEGADEIDITVVAGIVPDGSETKVTAGTNISVTGSGTISNPYIINSISNAGSVYIDQGDNIEITGNGAIDNPYIINANGVQSVTGNIVNNIDPLNPIITSPSLKTINGESIIGTGDIEIDNLQKVITYPTDFAGTNYNITNSDYNYVIFINNGTVDVSITLDASINIPNFSVGFIQEGSGTVTHLVSGVSLINTTGYKIKGIGSQTFIEKKLNTNIYYLLGNTKS